MQDVIGQPIEDRRAWRGEDLVGDEAWVVFLEENVVSDLTAVAQSMPDDTAAWLIQNYSAELNDETRSVLRSAGLELGDGRGFTLLRGVSAENPDVLRKVF